MSLRRAILKYRFPNPRLNVVLEDFKRRLNALEDAVDYAMPTTETDSTTEYAEYNTNYFSQPTTATSDVTFATVTAETSILTNLTDGFLPYHVDDSTGLANSDIYYDGTNVSVFKDATSGENPLLNIYGYITAGTAARYSSLKMDDTNDEFLIQTENNANHEGITIDLTESNQKFRVRQNSNYLSIRHDGTDPIFKTDDGAFTFQTDEGTNTTTTIRIKPKGAGAAACEVWDQDESTWGSFWQQGGSTNLMSAVNDPLRINYLNNKDVTFFEGSEPGTGYSPAVKIYGYTKGEDSWISLKIQDGDDGQIILYNAAVSNELHIGAFGTGIMSFGYEGGGDNFYARMQDEYSMAFGTNLNYGIVYYDTDDTLQFVDGHIMNTNVRADMNNTGLFTFYESIALKTTGEIRFYDADNSHYVGFEAPALTANQIWVLPATDDNANKALCTDGSGNLQWLGHDDIADADHSIYVLRDGTTPLTANWNVGNYTLTAAGLTLADGGSLSLQEDITFTGATTENLIKMPDNLLDALSIQEGSNKYITFDTVDDEEDILFYKSVDILHTSTHTDDHALEIDTDAAGYGDVKAIDLDYITGNITQGEDEGILLLNIDRTLATGGDIFALEVLATDQVSGSTGIYGLKIGPEIGPVHQDSGVFIDATLATDNTPTTHVPVMADGILANTTAIFESNNEYIIIGADTAFEDIELVFSTPASKNIRPTFWYSISGIDTFTQFTPVDGTDGCRHTGVISWDASDLSNHVADDTTGKFDIKIIRTKAGSMTTPVLGYAKTVETVEYVWDENGDVNIRNLAVAGTLDCGYLTVTDANEAIAIIGGATGDANRTWIAFYDSNIVRRGYVGDASDDNDDIYLASDTGDIQLIPGGGNVLITGAVSATTVDIGSTIAVTGTLDEDNMVSDSAVKICTQQSIKAYADSVAGGAAFQVAAVLGTL